MISFESVQEWIAPAIVWLRSNVLDAYVFVQLALAAATWLLAAWGARHLRPRAEQTITPWLARWRLARFGEVLVNSATWILFLIPLWLIVGVMREITWPSRSYVLGVVVSLASAWVVIRLISAAIRNATVARFAAVVLWSLAALNVTGLLDPTLSALDAIAFRVGENRVSLVSVLTGAGSLAILLWTAVALGRFIETRVHTISDLTPSMQVLMAQLAKIALLAFALLVALNTMGIDVTALTVFSGALGVGIGFGLQKVVSNLVSGLILLLDKSIKPGDVIEVGDTFGWINTLGARYVSVVTRDGKEYLIPNDDLITQRVVNWSFSNQMVRLDVNIGIDYASDVRAARRAIAEAAKKPARVMTNPAPVCHLAGLGDSSVDLLLRFWISDPQNGLSNVKGEVLQEVWDALKENGINIPFPHREVILRHAPPSVSTENVIGTEQGLTEQLTR